MDKKKKKYIVLTIIAVLLIGLLILINVIGAGTKSASAESTDTTVTEEYTDLSDFYPNGNSNYKYYAIYLTENRKYQISWFTTNTQGQLYGLKNCVKDFTSEEITKFNPSYSKYYYLGMEEFMFYATAMAGAEMGTTFFNGLQADEGYFTVSSSFDSDVYTSNSYDTLDDLYSAIFYKDVSYSSSKEIKKSLTNIYFDINILSSVSIFDTSTCYSNYDEMIPTFELPLNSSGEVELIFYTEVAPDCLLDELNKLSFIYDDSYNEGYNEAIDKTWFGVFTDAVIEKIYKPSTWEDTSTDIIFTTYGISFDNAFAKIEEYRKTNQTPDTEAFYIQLKFSKPFKFQNDNDFYAKLYTNKKVMQSWFESETGRQIFITTDEEPNPNGFGYRIKTSEDLSEPITVRRLIICYTPYYKDTLASDFVDLGTGTNATEYNNGYVTGKNEGFENGYAQGKNDGYKNGYSAGLIEGQGPTTSIQKLIASVQAALNVDLFGSISLQDILNVMISIFFVLIALKLFAGG